MITERLNDGYDTLLRAIKIVEAEGYKTEFFIKKDGFEDPKTKTIYKPDAIENIEYMRIQAPLSDPDEESILYLIVTKNQNKGWISDSYGVYSDSNLKNLLNKVEQLNIPE